MNAQPLFTVAIVSFNQFNIIRECIDSVLIQDYPNIELIVFNDATGDFDKATIEQYVRENAKSNIKSYFVNQNLVRLGTVRNANQAFDKAKGEYLKLIAADDSLWDSTVLSQFAEVFKDKDANVAVGRSLVVSASGVVMKQYPDSEKWNLINNSTPGELFEANIYTNLIHSPGVAIKKKFWIEMGRFNENYYLAEDWPLWLKICRCGHRFYTIKNPAVKYRYGGVSNSTSPDTQKYKAECWKDVIDIMEHEILPYSNLLKSASIRYLKYSLRLLKLLYFRDFEYKDSTSKKKFVFRLKFGMYCLEKTIRQRYQSWCANLNIKVSVKPYLIALLFFVAAMYVQSMPETINLVFWSLMIVGFAETAYGALITMRYLRLKFRQSVDWIKNKLS